MHLEWYTFYTKPCSFDSHIDPLGSCEAMQSINSMVWPIRNCLSIEVVRSFEMNLHGCNKNTYFTKVNKYTFAFVTLS